MCVCVCVCERDFEYMCVCVCVLGNTAYLELVSQGMVCQKQMPIHFLVFVSYIIATVSYKI